MKKISTITFLLLLGCAIAFGQGVIVYEGDVTSVGDCPGGACGDGSSDGGGYLRLYDGDSHYGQIDVENLSADRIITIPNAAGIIALTTSNVATASALAANGENCAAGQSPLGVDASGAAESCFDVWTESENTSAGYISSVASDSAWTTHNSYPDACGAGTWATAIGDTLTCSDPTSIDDCTAVNACTIDAESMEGTDWGTMTNAQVCVYDSAGTEVDCATSIDASGACGTGAICGGGHTHGSTEITEADPVWLSEKASYAPLVSPSFTTPILGAATATSINKLTLTQPATGSTLTIADGKVLTVTNTANINTLTDGKWCKYTAAGTLIDCDVDPVTAASLAQTLALGADANDVTITSLAKLEGLDNALYVDMGNDTYINIAADAYVDLSTPDVRVQDNLQLDSDGAIIELGADQDVTITHVADTGVLLALDKVIQFGDAAVFISSDDDGYLDLDADTGIRLNGAVTGSSTHTFADLPAIGNDPDVATAGYIGRDNDDHWLRGYDGTIQFIYGQKTKVISGTATNPDLLTEAAFLPVWTNQLGASFVIDNIYAVSDVDDAAFTLKYTTNGYTDHTNLTTIEAITISTDSTGIYSYTIAYADIDNATIADGATIGFDAGATDCDFIHFVIEGHLLGDVN